LKRSSFYGSEIKFGNFSLKKPALENFENLNSSKFICAALVDILISSEKLSSKNIDVMRRSMKLHSMKRRSMKRRSMKRLSASRHDRTSTSSRLEKGRWSTSFAATLNKQNEVAEKRVSGPPFQIRFYGGGWAMNKATR
jgi:hypothetical protein